MFVLFTLMACEHRQVSSSTPLSSISEVEQTEKLTPTIGKSESDISIKSAVHRATTEHPPIFLKSNSAVFQTIPPTLDISVSTKPPLNSRTSSRSRSGSNHRSRSRYRSRSRSRSRSMSSSRSRSRSRSESELTTTVTSHHQSHSKYESKSQAEHSTHSKKFF